MLTCCRTCPQWGDKKHHHRTDFYSSKRLKLLKTAVHQPVFVSVNKYTLWHRAQGLLHLVHFSVHLSRRTTEYWKQIGCITLLFKHDWHYSQGAPQYIFQNNISSCHHFYFVISSYIFPPSFLSHINLIPRFSWPRSVIILMSPF